MSLSRRHQCTKVAVGTVNISATPTAAEARWSTRQSAFLYVLILYVPLKHTINWNDGGLKATPALLLPDPQHTDRKSAAEGDIFVFGGFGHRFWSC